MYKDFSNYEIFADSRIWSKKRKKWLKPKTLPNGYQQVCLYDNEGKKHYERWHKVIYFAVNGLWEYPDGMEIHHCDEVRTNNQIANLLLCSHRENCNFGTRNEKISKRVAAYDKNGELIMVFPSTREAGRQGFRNSHVSACCRGERKTHKGYTWKYLDDDDE